MQSDFHVTTAVVVERDNQFLMVEETDKHSGRKVLNQPAGHLEHGESVIDGAMRETFEETGCIVRPVSVISVGLYYSLERAATYCRITLHAELVSQDFEAQLDPDIEQVHWMTMAQISQNSDKLRSPLVLDALERYQAHESYPLRMLAML